MFPIVAPAIIAPAPQESSFPARFQQALRQPLTPETLDRVRRSVHLAGALREIAYAVRLPVLIEGNPYRPPNQTIAQVISPFQDGRAKPTAEDIVRALVRLYDYEVGESNGILLLYKRYTRSDDFPEVTMAEMQHFLSATAKMVRTHAPDFSEQRDDLRFLNFANSLTPEQWELWKPKERPASQSSLQLTGVGILFRTPDSLWLSPGIPVSLLTAAQKTTVRTLALEVHLSRSLSDLEHYSGILAADWSQLFFRQRTLGTNKILDCIYPWKSGTHRLSFMMGAPDATGWLYSEWKGTHPKPDDYDATGKPLPRPVEVTEFSHALGELASQYSGTGIALHVSSALAAKTVNLLNPPTDVHTIGKAIGALYNLRVRTSETEVNLDLPAVPSVRVITEVPAAIDRLIPGPLSRLIFGLKESGFRLEQGREKPGETRRAQPVRRNASDDMANGLHGMRYEALRRLRIRIESKIAASQDKTITWGQMDTEERWLTSFLVVSQVIPVAVGQSTLGLPDSLRAFEESNLVGKVYEKNDRAWLEIGLRSKAGDEGFSRMGQIRRP